MLPSTQTYCGGTKVFCKSMSETIENQFKNNNKSNFFRKRPDASKCIRMRPSRSEWIRIGPNTSLNLRKLLKTSKKIQSFPKNLKRFAFVRAVHSGERGCYRSNRKNYRIDRIELRKKNVFGRLFFFVGRSEGDGAVLIISKNLRRQIF